MRKVKQDDKFSLAIREIQSQHPANKKCFDCDQRGEDIKLIINN